MTILTTTEYRTIDPTAGYRYNGVIHVGFFIEEDTLVTLTCAEEVTSYGMSQNLSICTRYTNGTTCHRDIGCTLYVGCLATAIDTCQDMATTDFYIGITLNSSCRTDILTDTVLQVRHTTRASTEDITIVGVTIGCNPSATFSRYATGILAYFPSCIGIRVIGCERCFIFPAGALCQRFRSPLISGVTTVHTVTGTNLSALDIHLGIMLNKTVLATAINRTLNEGISLDGDLSLSRQCQGLDKVKVTVFISSI